MTLSRSSILFHWDAAYGRGVYPTVGGFPELTRNGAAFGRNMHGTLIRHPASTPRFEPATIRGLRRPVMVLEAARTNELLQSEDFSDAAWSKSGVIVTADDEVAPDGRTTADKIEDDSDTAHEWITQSISYTATELVALSVFLKKRADGPIIAMFAQFTGGVGNRFPRIQVDPATGDFAFIDAVDTVRVDGGVEEAGEWWRVFWVGRSDADHTGVVMRLDPARNVAGGSISGADVATTGFNHFWGTQLEKAASPSSYIKTTTSATSRAADNVFEWKGVPAGQAIFLYLDTLWQGDLGTAVAGIALGPDGGGQRLSLLQNGSNELQVTHNNGVDAAVFSTVSPALGIFDPLEGLIILNSDGSIRAAANANGTILTGTVSGAPASGIVDLGEVIALNSRPNGTVLGVGRYARALVGKLADLETVTDGTADEALLEEIRTFCNRIMPAGEVR